MPGLDPLPLMPGGLRPGRGACRDDDRKGSSQVHFRLQLDLESMHLGDTLQDGEPEAGSRQFFAASRGVRPEESIEDALLHRETFN